MERSQLARKCGTESEQHALSRHVCDLIPQSILDIRMSDHRSVTQAKTVVNAVAVISIHAIEAFLENNLQSFDAHVGNNSCHLVAAACLFIRDRFDHDHQFVHHMKSVQTGLERFRHQFMDACSSQHVLSQEDRFGQFLKHIGSDLCFDADILFLALAYGCGLTRQYKDKHLFTAHSNVSDYLHSRINISLSNKVAKKLVRHWQIQLSQIIVVYLSQCLVHADEKNKIYGKYVAEEHRLEDDFGRLCVSNLYSMRLILSYILSTQKILGIKMRAICKKSHCVLCEFTRFYKGCPFNNTLIPLSEESSKNLSTNSAILVLSGYRKIEPSNNRENSLNKTSDFMESSILLDAIRANDVYYPEFPGNLKSCQIQPEEQWIKQEIDALKTIKGVSLCDPSLFCIDHIHADTALNFSSETLNTPHYLSSYQKNDEHSEAKTYAYPKRVNLFE